jgi:prephenate dehydrogenase
MWAPILTENKENILSAMDGYIANLTAFRNKIEAGDNKGLYEEMAEINKIRDILDLGK